MVSLQESEDRKPLYQLPADGAVFLHPIMEEQRVVRHEYVEAKGT
jgi:hypothetical protein